MRGYLPFSESAYRSQRLLSGCIFYLWWSALILLALLIELAPLVVAAWLLFHE